jgi:hypothetical protein
MSARRVVALAATVALSAGAGWVARGPQDSAAKPAPPAVARPAPALPAPDAVIDQPLIAVSGDGQVTLRVEQRPLDWVLEQIALQSGRADLLGAVPAAAGAGSPSPAALPVPPDTAEGEAAEPPACPPPIAPADPGRLVQTIEQGADEERLPALQRARADGVPVPEAVLRTLIETAASDRVRLAALDSWLELRAGDPTAERAALEASLHVPNAAVQRDARQRLDDMNETERLDALAAQGSP